MKTKQVYIWSAFWKHGWILLKPGVQVSIGYCIIENENRVTEKSKMAAGILKKRIFFFFYFFQDLWNRIFFKMLVESLQYTKNFTRDRYTNHKCWQIILIFNFEQDHRYDEYDERKNRKPLNMCTRWIILYKYIVNNFF